MKLHRIILLITLLFGYMGMGIAQETSFGVKAGINLANMSADGPDDQNLNPGFHGGAFINIPVASKISLQPEVLYSEKGLKATYDEEFVGLPVVEGETTLNIQYIDVPVYLIYDVTENLNFRVGPYISFLLDGNIETNADILDFINIESSDDFGREHYKNTDIGVSAGLGFEFRMLRVGLNCNFGMAQAAENNEASEVLIGDARNNVIQGYVGVAF